MAGLDPEDVAMLSGLEQADERGRQDILQSILKKIDLDVNLNAAEKAAKAKTAAAVAAAAEKERIREAALEDERKYQEGRVTEERAFEAPQREATLAATEALTQQRLREPTATGLTPSEQLAKNKFDVAQQQKTFNNMKVIQDDDTSIDNAIELAQQENTRPAAGVVYVIDEPFDAAFWSLKFDNDGSVQAITIPERLKFFNGKPSTGNDIIQAAARVGMPVADYIKAAQ